MNYLEELPKLDIMNGECKKIFDLLPGQFVASYYNCIMMYIYTKDIEKYISDSRLSNLFTDCVYIGFNSPQDARKCYIGECANFPSRYNPKKIFMGSGQKRFECGTVIIFTTHSSDYISGKKLPFTVEKRKFVEASRIRSFDIESGYEQCNGDLYSKGLPKVDANHIDYLSEIDRRQIELIYQYTNYAKCFKKDTQILRYEKETITNLEKLRQSRDGWITDEDKVNNRERWRGMRAKPSHRPFSESVGYLHGMTKYMYANGGRCVINEVSCANIIKESGKKYRKLGKLICDKKTLFSTQDRPYLHFLGLTEPINGGKLSHVVEILTERGKKFTEICGKDYKSQLEYIIVALEEWYWGNGYITVRDFCRTVYNTVGKPTTKRAHQEEFMYIVSHGGVLEYFPYDSKEAISELVIAFRNLSIRDRELFCKETDDLIMKRLGGSKSKLDNEKGDYDEAYEDIYGYEFLEDHSKLLNKFKGTRSDVVDFLIDK